MLQTEMRHTSLVVVSKGWKEAHSIHLQKGMIWRLQLHFGLL